jgi:RNA polymerase sigma-70 factor (ECF subfamily)
VDLYREHGHGLFAYARSLTGRRDAAEDIVQETFLRVLESGATPSPAYLYGIARNLAMDALRQAERRRRHEPELARSAGARAARAFDDERALLSALLAELEDLPLEQREVVVLKTVGGLTFEEIGAILRIPPATGASRYRYAIEKLTARLTAREETA